MSYDYLIENYEILTFRACLMIPAAGSGRGILTE